MALFFRFGLACLLLLLTVFPTSAETLYNQPPFSEKELNQFIADLPRFRAWIKTNKEKAHPSVNEAGEPDFLYSRTPPGISRLRAGNRNAFSALWGGPPPLSPSSSKGTPSQRSPPLKCPM